MKGAAEIVTLLNDLLTNELTSVNEFLAHAQLCENWGFQRLAAKLKEESDEERKHADEIIERILYLEGVPDLQRLNPLQIGKAVKTQFESDLKLEKTAIDFLNKGIQKARDLGDNGTEALLMRILTSEEGHAHWLEAQLELIQQVGLQNYLAEQIRS